MRLLRTIHLKCILRHTISVVFTVRHFASNDSRRSRWPSFLLETDNWKRNENYCVRNEIDLKFARPIYKEQIHMLIYNIGILKFSETFGRIKTYVNASRTKPRRLSNFQDETYGRKALMSWHSGHHDHLRQLRGRRVVTNRTTNRTKGWS